MDSTFYGQSQHNVLIYSSVSSKLLFELINLQCLCFCITEYPERHARPCRWVVIGNRLGFKLSPQHLYRLKKMINLRSATNTESGVDLSVTNHWRKLAIYFQTSWNLLDQSKKDDWALKETISLHIVWLFLVSFHSFHDFFKHLCV